MLQQIFQPLPFLITHNFNVLLLLEHAGDVDNTCRVWDKVIHLNFIFWNAMPRFYFCYSRLIFKFSFSEGVKIPGIHNIFLAGELYLLPIQTINHTSFKKLPKSCSPVTMMTWVFLQRHSNLQMFSTTSKLLAWETTVRMFTYLDLVKICRIKSRLLL